MGLVNLARAETSKVRRTTNFEELDIGELFSYRAEVMLKISRTTAFSFTIRSIIHNIERDVSRLSGTMLWEVEHEFNK